MNPSDDEEVTEKSTQESEDIDVLLEPKAIPDERIVRHAERNDSYREDPALSNDEEIIQPPLEPEVIAESDTASVVQDEIIPEETRSEVTLPEDTLTEEIPPKALEALTTPEMPLISQIDIEPISHKEQEVSISPVEPKVSELVVEQVVPKGPEPLPQTEQSPVKQPQPIPQSQPQVVYHTVSGGPETIHDTMSTQHKVEEPVHSPVSATYPTIMSASGYTIPNPNYVQPVRVDLEAQNNFGITLFLIIMALVGGSATYLYFFMPEVFDQIYDAVVIVFNQLVKK